ncbi:hypothetical protein M0R45_015043 [Rubus argutus]|uniref:Uncharacterized protein n=1 Tax=Rubus argutus TaxID=59490 RepID=A0AAW1XQQ1_RUBAR
MTLISLSAITATINAVKNSCSSPPQHAQTTIPARVLFGPEPPQSPIAPLHSLRRRSLSNHTPIPTLHCSTRAQLSPSSSPRRRRSSA